MRFVPGRCRNFDEAVLRERLVELRNLVTLGQIGVEVIFAGEDGVLTDLAIEREGGQHGELNSAPIEDGQRSGQTEAYRADVGVRGRAELLAQPQNALVSVRSWTWTSSPITGS